jgi:phenylacetic acid degradation operon negative regulatory protein
VSQPSLQRPRALIVSVYGMYAREFAGWMSVASIIQLLAELSVDEAAVRSAISRLKRRDILTAERVDGVAGYGLSPQARVILDEGDRRIFRRRRASVSDGWVLAVFSVPEVERFRRHQLRSRLAGLGFGTVAAGVWIAPAHIYDEARQTLERVGLSSYVDLFRADHLAFADSGARLTAWWDLPRLESRYSSFLSSHGRVLASYRRGRRPSDRPAFAHFVSALTDWRRLPYADPGLPAELLPRRWIGLRAAEIFFELYDRLAEPAHRFVASQVTLTDLRPLGPGSQRTAKP